MHQHPYGRNRMKSRSRCVILQRIRAKRKEAGYSQEKLAEHLMIKQNTLSKYENDEHDVPTDILSKLSKILDTPPSYLVWGSSEEEGWLLELRILAGNIKNPVIREAALKQMLALVQMDEAVRRYPEMGWKYPIYNDMEEKRAKAEKREPELIPSFSAHNLRHTFCTRFCENETNIKVIQEVMGHKDVQTTLDIYAESTTEKKQEVINSLQGKIIIK